jgi:PIF1-like helicase/Helix-turn-helix domain/HRDC domain
MESTSTASTAVATLERLSSNPELELAFELVRFTNKSLFLTGKAGSGKTTFLRKVCAEATKRLAVVAPTGVAAVDAGGMTIHSLFQIPFGIHWPGTQRSNQEPQRKFSANKIRLLRSLDLLIIDEISMVRADLLDAIDDVLRRYRNSMHPFGGVQLLMIGDLHQLPPVARADEWSVLSKHYESPFFFASRALKQTDYQSIELKQIFRQSDPEFISLLNQVRNNCMDSESLRKLNTRYQPGFQPPRNQSYITLTTTNAVAQEINASNLQDLPGKSRTYTAQIQGEFPASCYPTDLVQEFKKDAQVMFLKNDPERRYFNGKIGQIVYMDAEVIEVICPGERTAIAVTPAEWNNVKYSLNDETKQIEEQLLGSFTQMPLKLAWAITIHKSQGLTFERAIIDAQSAFASGQVYVALSRCKSFEGIVLRSPLDVSSIKTDSVVQQFTAEADRNSPDKAYLENARREFECQLLKELFEFDPIRQDFNRLLTIYQQHSGSLGHLAVAQLQAVVEIANEELFVVVRKFAPQLDGYLKLDIMPSENSELQARLVKASAYFHDKLVRLNAELKNTPTLTDNQQVNDSITKLMRSLQLGLFTKSVCFQSCGSGFSSSEYQRAKVNAELDFYRASNRTSGKPHLSVPQGVPHGELYGQLQEWRFEMAEERSVGVPAIFPNATLRALVETLPINLAQLQHVPGIGKKRLKSLGQQLCDIIEKYCEQHSIARDQTPAAEVSRSSTNPADTMFRISEKKQQSFDLYRSGKSVAEIAAERGVTPSTIEGHLVPFIANGQIDVFALVSREAVEEIAQCIHRQPDQSVADLKKEFGNKYGYGEIKMTISHLQSQRANRDV